MKQAQRVYLRHKFGQKNESSFFKSNVQRSEANGSTNRHSEPGPGSYDVVLPMIKPKYEAIIKNNRSIIIKVNDVPVPPFFSKQQRFKQDTTLQNSQQIQTNNDLNVYEQQQWNKIKNSRRYNFSIARKKSFESISKTIMLANNNKNNKQIQNDKAKGAEWSKYRQQRQLWELNSSNPGPGSYQSADKESKHQVKQKNSWQFRSQTKRYGKLENKWQIPEIEQKINSIHSRHNLLSYQQQ